MVSGVVIALCTVWLSYQTRWDGGITLWEEAPFLAVAVILVVIGSLFLLRCNTRRAELQEWVIELERERNKWIHEETMAKTQAVGPPGCRLIHCLSFPFRDRLPWLIRSSRTGASRLGRLNSNTGVLRAADALRVRVP